MRHFFLSIICTLSASAFAGTALRIPVFIAGVPVANPSKQKKDRTIPVRWLNAKIKKAGLKEIAEYVEMSDREDAKQFQAIDAQIAEAANALGKDYDGIGRANEAKPQENRAGAIETCYTGRADGVADVVGRLADAYYSDQIGVWGWRYKNIFKLIDGRSDQRLGEQSKLWKSWRGDDDSVLILTHEGDDGGDGDDVADAIIPRCDS